jgi:hypothetical protein
MAVQGGPKSTLSAVDTNVLLDLRPGMGRFWIASRQSRRGFPTGRIILKTAVGMDEIAQVVGAEGLRKNRNYSGLRGLLAGLME